MRINSTTLVVSTLFTLAAALSPAPSRAAVIYGEASDGMVMYSPINNQLYTGYSTNNVEEIGINGGLERAFLFVFKLPALQPGQQVASASFASSVAYNFLTDRSVDLYALPYRSAFSLQTADYYAGPADPNPNATLLQQSYLTPSTPANDARATTSASANTALAAYLNAQYAAGALAGDYVVLRAARSDTSGSSYSVAGFDTADLAPYLANYYANGNPSNYNYYMSTFLPRYAPALDITLTPVPEPTTASLALLGLAVPLLRRRRHA